MKYAITVIAGLLLLGALGIASATSHGPDTRLRLVDTVDVPRSNGRSIVQPGGVYYSHYSANGNDSDIVRLDPDTGTLETLVAGVRNAGFVAVDERYVLYAASQGLPPRLYLRDRRTGAEARSIRLRDHILRGWIYADHILVLQRNEALTFSIPDLKLVRKVPIGFFGRMVPAGPEQIQPWKDRIVAAAEHLVVVDSSATLLAHYPLPRSPPRNNRRCGVVYLRVFADTALLGLSCGAIHAIDLNTGATRYEIDVGGFTPLPAILNGVLYVGDRGEYSPRRLQMFDAQTGRSLGRVPYEVEMLVAGARRLMIMHSPGGYRELVKATLLEPDVEAIRDPATRETRLLDGCAVGTDVERTELHRAIDSCDDAGVRDYLDVLGVEPLSPPVREALESHAVRLAQTFSRYDESVPLLEKLGAMGRYKSLQLGVERKAELLEGPPSEPSSAPLPAGVRTYSPGVAPTHFIGPHAFVTSWTCAGNDGDHVALRVFDRASLRRLGEVPLVACDDEYQDAISSVSVIDGYVIVGLVARYDDPRPNVGVIRLSDLSLVGVTQVEGGAPELVPLQGQLVHCSTRQELDLATATFRPAPAVALDACPSDAAAEAAGDIIDPHNPEPLQSQSYQIARSGIPGGGYRFVARGPDGEGAPFSFESRLWSIYTAHDSDTVIIHEPVNDSMRLVAVDLRTHERKTLIELGNATTWGPFARWGRFFFIAHGRDLMTLDLERQRVVGYEKDIVRVGQQPVCQGCSDSNRIAGFVFDQDRLFATTRGAISLAIDLPEYSRTLSTDDLLGID